MADMREFLEKWQIDPISSKSAFLQYRDTLLQYPQLQLEFAARPGISYSLRAKKGDKIVALVDVVDDEPENRWLSVCFYADMVSDPDDLGDFVPQGLFGEDAICFNLDEDDQTARSYINDRINEAASKRGE